MDEEQASDNVAKSSAASGETYRLPESIDNGLPLPGNTLYSSDLSQDTATFAICTIM